MSSTSSIVLAPPADMVKTARYMSVSILIVDQSGSMGKFGDAPKTQVNKFLEELGKDKNADAMMLGVVTFNDDARIGVPLTRATAQPRLEAYQAGGNTLLYFTVFEAMGALSLLVDERTRAGGKTDVLVSVLTDGQDTHSPNGTLEQLHALATRCRGEGWQLRVFGFGVDGSAIAEKMGFTDQQRPTVNCEGVRVDPSDDGIARSVAYVSRSTSHTTDLGRSGRFTPPSSS